jgi:hypothetical protein
MGWSAWLKNRRSWGFTASGVIGFLAFSCSLAWLFIIAAKWSREHQLLRGLISSHFLYDILVGAALWYQTMRLEKHQKTLELHYQTMARMPSPDQLDFLEIEMLKRAERLRADPSRSTSKAEELQAASLLEKAASMAALIKMLFEKREGEKSQGVAVGR